MPFAVVAEGTLTGVPLAVVTLTTLAAFEAVTVLPAAATQLGAARASATCIAAVLDAAEPVADPLGSGARRFRSQPPQATHPRHPPHLGPRR